MATMKVTSRGRDVEVEMTPLGAAALLSAGTPRRSLAREVLTLETRPAQLSRGIALVALGALLLIGAAVAYALSWPPAAAMALLVAAVVAESVGMFWLSSAPRHVFNRAEGSHVSRKLGASRTRPLANIVAVQAIRGEPATTSAGAALPTYELNLVCLENGVVREALCRVTSDQWVHDAAVAVAAFLSVPLAKDDSAPGGAAAREKPWQAK